LLNEIKYSLPKFSDFVLEIVLPLMNLKGLYEETANLADSIPLVTEVVITFIKNLYTENEPWFRENFGRILLIGKSITQYNAMPTFWNVFTIMDEEMKVKNLSLKGVDLESLNSYFIKEIKTYPPYRRLT